MSNPYAPLPSSESQPTTETETLVVPTPLGLISNSVRLLIKNPGTPIIAWLSLTIAPAGIAGIWIALLFELFSTSTTIKGLTVLIAIALFVVSNLLIGSSYQYEVLKKTRLLPSPRPLAHIATILLLTLATLGVLAGVAILPTLGLVNVAVYLGISSDNLVVSFLLLACWTAPLLGLLCIQGNLLLIFHENPTFRFGIFLEAFRRTRNNRWLIAKLLLGNLVFFIPCTIFFGVPVMGLALLLNGNQALFALLLTLSPWPAITATTLLFLTQMALLFPRQPRSA